MKRARTIQRARRVGAILGVLVAAAAFAGCDFCSDGDLRCNGSEVEMCSGGNWETEGDCGTDTCAIGRDQCGDPFLDFGFGEVWCCKSPPP